MNRDVLIGIGSVIALGLVGWLVFQIRDWFGRFNRFFGPMQANVATGRTPFQVLWAFLQPVIVFFTISVVVIVVFCTNDERVQFLSAVQDAAMAVLRALGVWFTLFMRGTGNLFHAAFDFVRQMLARM